MSAICLCMQLSLSLLIDLGVNELRPTRVLELLSKHSIELELINSLNFCTFDGVPNKI